MNARFPQCHRSYARLIWITPVVGLFACALGGLWHDVRRSLADESPAAGEANEANNEPAAEPSAKPPEREALPQGLHVVALRVMPERIELAHRFDYRQLLVVGELATGETIDATRMVTVASQPTGVAVSPAGLVSAQFDADAAAAQPFEGEIVFALGELQARVPVALQLGEAPFEPNYVQHVTPILSKVGCNAGTCHGSAQGKNGFQLSLRGYDPVFDHRALTDDVAARRFNRVDPDRSLMLLKTSGGIPHQGGVLTKPGEPYYEILRRWIAAGAPLDLEVPRVVSIAVEPQNPIVPLPGMTQQMIVRATYSDGSVRDVTREAFVESGNIEVATGDKRGVMTTLRRGEAAVLARYEGAYAATTVTVMGDREGFEWKQPEAYNYIDELVYEKQQRVKVLPSDVCTDAEFVRRVYLDLTGLPPTADETRAFIADERASRAKRDELIDRLIGSPEFVELWTNKWADLLQVNRKFLGVEGSVALRNWIKQSIAENKPYDQFAKEILTASGSTMANPPAAYWKVLREPDLAMENTTHLFLAIRFNCNKCHDHPFERWTQDQYYHLSAYFARIDRQPDPDPQYKDKKIEGSAVMDALPLVETIADAAQGEMKHERTGLVAPPQFPYDHPDMPADEVSRREQLTHWITSKDNPYFARSYVNRVWGYLTGVGIIEPIDDIRAGNPPTNPALLDALEREFIESGFDVQHLMRTICKSRTYQLSIVPNEWNADDEHNYAKAMPRRLPAEVMYDAIYAASGAKSRIPGVPDGTRAAALPDAGVSLPFLDDFGRPPRESACECERSSGIVLGPIMKLAMGPTVADALADANNAIAALAAKEPDDKKLIEEIFLRFLSRYPTERELNIGMEALRDGGNDYDAIAAEFKRHEAQLDEQQAAWEAALARPPRWRALEQVQASSNNETHFATQDDGSLLASGEPKNGVYRIVARVPAQKITGIQLEALPDASLPQGGPGRASNGNFVVNELRLLVQTPARPAQGDQPAVEATSVVAPLQNARASFNQEGWAVTGAIDGNGQSGWAVSPQFNKRHVASFETVEEVTIPEGAEIVIEIDHQYPDQKHLLGKFRLMFTDSPRPHAVTDLPAALAEVLSVEPAERSEAQRKLIADHFRSGDAEYQRLKAAFDQVSRQKENPRLTGAQDLAWALINNPAFLFNR